MTKGRLSIKLSDEEYALVCTIRRLIHAKGLDWVNEKVGYELFTEDDFHHGRVTNRAIIGKCASHLIRRLRMSE